LGLFLSSSVSESIIPEIAAFGDKVLGREVLHPIADTEKNPPYLRTWDTWGKRRDELVTGEGCGTCRIPVSRRVWFRLEMRTRMQSIFESTISPNAISSVALQLG
jgi:hypothetical protein